MSVASPPAAPPPAPLDLLTVYKQLATLPEVTGAFILSPTTQPNPPDILVTTTVRDLHQDIKRDYVTTYTHSSTSSIHNASASASRVSSPFAASGGLNLGSSGSSSSGATAFAGSYQHNFPTPTDTLLTLPSPSGRLLLVVKKLSPPNGGPPPPPTAPPQYVHDVYERENGRLLYSVPTTGVHGRILFGGCMGGVRWEEQREEAVLYSAERAEPVKKGWYDEVKSNATASTMRDKLPDSRGRQYDWKEEWGEQMAGISTPRLYVLALPPALSPTLNAHVLAVHGGIPAARSCGGAVWCGVDGLLYVGWEREAGRRLGIAVYNTRRSRLYYVGWQRKTEAEAKAEEKQRAEGRQPPHTADDQPRPEGQPPLASQPTDNADEDGEEEEEDDEEEEVDQSVLLTPDDHSPISPRLSHDLTALVYTTTERTWHHWSGSQLRKVAWDKVAAAVRAEYERKKAGSENKEGSLKGGGLLSSVLSALSLNNAPSTSSSSAATSSSASATVDLTALLRAATTTVIDLVDRPRTVHSFPGLYPPVGMLPPSPWLGNSHVLLTSYWRHTERILLINTLTAAIIPVPLPPVSHLILDGSMQILHVKGSRLLAHVSTPVRTGEVWLLELSRYKTDSDGQWIWNVKEGGTTTPPATDYDGNNGGDDESEGKKEAEWSVGRREKVFVRWELVSDGPRCLDPRVQERLDSVQWDVLRVQPPRSAAGTPASYSELPFDAVFLCPTFHSSSSTSSASSSSSAASRLPSLHLVPHGGPHASYTTSFSFSAAFLLCCNFALLLPNYRGSTAYGQASLTSLPGRCGRQDVDDCMLALDACLHAKSDVIDTTRIGVMGGSHGGFLTTHLIGQYPERFYVASTRNPVCNLAVTAALSDIPDWAYVEAGLQYSPARAPTQADYAQLFAMSPIAHVGRVRTPLLLLLGTGDRRVPMAQAVDYYRLLRSGGLARPVRCLVYGDAQHGLNDKVGQEGDVWVNTALWMMERWGDVDDDRDAADVDGGGGVAGVVVEGKSAGKRKGGKKGTASKKHKQVDLSLA